MTSRHRKQNASRPDLHDFVAASLPDATDRRQVAAIERAPFDRSSSYPAEIVTVRFADGRQLRLFLKDLSTRRYDEADIADRRDREIAVYREILAGSGLGAPRYHGSLQDPEENHFWLLLEFVDGMPVRWEPFEVWVEAAAWLGRLHALVVAEPALLTRCQALQVLTADFFVETATAATAAATAFAPALGRRVAQALHGYADVAEAMAAAPRTLVHGGYRPQNILLRTVGSPGRICPTDWEEAAAGPTAYDLAYLSDGFDDSRRRALVGAYRTEAARHGLPLDDRETFEALLDACNLHKSLGTLRKAVDRDFPPDSVRRLVSMVEAAALRARGTGAGPARHGARSAVTPPRRQDDLRSDLERLLSRRRGVSVRVRDLGVSPSPFAGRAPADVVRVDLDGEPPTTVFLKHPAADDGHPDKRRRDREQRVYRDLLVDPDLPVADYLGSIVDTDGRESLVLTHVADWDLRYQSLDVWRVAASALGALHTRLCDRQRLDAVDALLRLDAAYLSAWARRAIDEVGRRWVDLGRRLEQALHGFDDILAPLDVCAPTLVHNDLAPKNVLADCSTDRTSIRIIDWELAGVGCGMLDLVHLCHGLDSDDARTLHVAYQRAVSGAGLLPDDSRDIARVEAACRIHRTVYRLAHIDVLGASAATVGIWVDEVVRLRATL